MTNHQVHGLHPRLSPHHTHSFCNFPGACAQPSSPELQFPWVQVLIHPKSATLLNDLRSHPPRSIEGYGGLSDGVTRTTSIRTAGFTWAHSPLGSLSLPQPLPASHLGVGPLPFLQSPPAPSFPFTSTNNPTNSHRAPVPGLLLAENSSGTSYCEDHYFSLCYTLL